jgi:Mg2+ and Co2+ transporter CorA
MYLTRRATIIASFRVGTPSMKAVHFLDPSDEDADIQELEDMLEFYFAQVDHAFNALTSLVQFVDRTEDFVNTDLDSSRNTLIQVDLLTSIAMLVTSLYTLVTGIFGMNLSA